MPEGMNSPLALAHSAQLRWERIGEEQRPLLIADGALVDPQHVRSIAARHKFTPIGPFYPGVRAAVPEKIAMDLVAPIMDALVAGFSLPGPARFRECFLSIVTTSPQRLQPIQRLPHFDGLEEGRIAVLVYLDPKESGGTAFYRQRATGFETVDASRYDRYRTSLEAEVARHGVPPSEYIGADTPLFSRIHGVEGVFNRIVAYRSNSLHCAALRKDFTPVADPIDGRLTLNLFLDPPASAAT